MAETRMTLYDHIWELEHKLDEPDRDFLNRRLLLRETLQAVWAEALRQGHTEGMRDVNDARFAEIQKAKAAKAGA